MLVQRHTRWADVAQMLYKCFVFTGIPRVTKNTHIRGFLNGNMFKVVEYSKSNKQIRNQ